ncbi:MAG: DUF2007 domain-containing protein [Gammaproteobacteria bacterium]|nr:DUF2007 domain-containing protein [Gammaproteobacteria bacterium]
MSDSARTVRVYKAAHAIEAHLLRGLLEQAGIEAYLVGEHQNRAYGAFSHLFAVEIRVPACDETEAREIVARFEADSAETVARPGWNCASCGESNAASFESCWNCGAVRAADRGAGDEFR